MLTANVPAPPVGSGQSVRPGELTARIPRRLTPECRERIRKTPAPRTARHHHRMDLRAGPRSRQQAVRNMPDPERKTARLPPRWFIRLAWITHRRLYRWTGGRLGLWRPKPGGWATLHLTTIGRRTGRARAVTVGTLRRRPELRHHGHERLGRRRPVPAIIMMCAASADGYWICQGFRMVMSGHSPLAAAFGVSG